MTPANTMSKSRCQERMQPAAALISYVLRAAACGCTLVTRAQTGVIATSACLDLSFMSLASSEVFATAGRPFLARSSKRSAHESLVGVDGPTASRAIACHSWVVVFQ